MKTIGPLAALILALLPFSAVAEEKYQTIDKKCYGFPQIPSIKTRPGECVGLVADRQNIDWKFPRKLLFDGDRLYVSAFGGWAENKGQVWELAILPGPREKEIKAHRLFDATNQTHGLRKGPDGKIYFADKETLYRFDPRQPSRLETVLTDLESSYVLSSGKRIGNHPLKEFIFLSNGDLVINIGSPSNDCAEEIRLSGQCKMRENTGLVRLYPYIPSTQSFDPRYTNLARGLRNSMGLLFNPKLQEIYQAENAADEVGTPDELNIISLQQIAKGKKYDFGWPFCFGNGQLYKGYANFRTFCGRTADKPHVLFPAHSAPLELIYYQGNMFPDLQGSLLTAWHGHRPSGSRIAIYAADSLGRPKAAAPTMLLDGWQADPRGRHPKGRPVGMAMDSRGAIFVIDDVNMALLVIAKSDEDSDASDSDVGKGPKVTAANLGEILGEGKVRDWERLFPTVIRAKQCSECHADVVVDRSARQSLANMINSNWVNVSKKGADEQPLWRRMTGAGGERIMPPAPKPSLLDDQRAGSSIVEQFRAWF